MQITVRRDLTRIEGVLLSLDVVLLKYDIDLPRIDVEPKSSDEDSLKIPAELLSSGVAPFCFDVHSPSLDADSSSFDVHPRSRDVDPPSSGMEPFFFDARSQSPGWETENSDERARFPIRHPAFIETPEHFSGRSSKNCARGAAGKAVESIQRNPELISFELSAGKTAVESMFFSLDRSWRWKPLPGL